MTEPQPSAQEIAALIGKTAWDFDIDNPGAWFHTLATTAWEPTE